MIGDTRGDTLGDWCGDGIIFCVLGCAGNVFLHILSNVGSRNGTGGGLTTTGGVSFCASHMTRGTGSQGRRGVAPPLPTFFIHDDGSYNKNGHLMELVFITFIIMTKYIN